MAAALPRRARARTFALLLLAVVLQRLAAAGGEGDAAFGGPRLGGQRDEPARAGALQGSTDCGGARVEVEVFPAQAEEFALAESGVESQFEQCVQPVSARGREKLAGFVGGEGFEASGAWDAGADVAGDVARDLFLADGVLQGGLEHGVDVGQRQRREQLAAALACGTQLVEPGADVLGRELRELLLAQAGDEVAVDAGGVAGVVFSRRWWTATFSSQYVRYAATLPCA
ncbi:hypothetical protein GCM10010222_80360 [Streptomyces tanashiensis]|nr:hypothetical protein GCM10010222_80360 [Streptomyces tanashiensis]